MMRSTSILAGLAALLINSSEAYIRFSCANALVEQRADPIVSPGKVAGHVHKIAGGGNFGFTMDFDQARASKCSSCPIKQDLSNYWTPKLYYQAKNGSFISVPTVGDGASEQNGGMTVYYQQRGPSPSTLKAFPPGFRMLAGDAMKRNFTGGFDADAITFACLGAGKGETNSLPNYNCPSGLRAQVYFPSCWNGKDLDSPNHKSHMSYPASGAYNSGPCPSTHPVQLVSLFFEVLYDTNSFKDMWYNSGQQPFVFAQGDPTGYGFHGDFVNGWDVNTLQQVITQCTDDSKFGSTDKSACPPIDLYTSSEMNACRIPPSVDEDVKGLLPLLPGCNPVNPGPAPTVPGTNCPKGAVLNAVIGQPETYFTDVTKTKGYAYQGCASDSSGTRTLGDASTVYMGVGSTMTVEWCIDWCSGKGYTYAGLEFGQQCFCGNSVASDRAPKQGILGQCTMKCLGDSGEYCGGSSQISLYKKCSSASDCVNALYTTVGNTTAAAAPAVASSSSSKPASSSSSTRISSSTTSTRASSTTTSSTRSTTTTSARSPNSSTLSTTTRPTSSSSTRTSSSSTTTITTIARVVSTSKSGAGGLLASRTGTGAGGLLLPKTKN